MSNILSRKQIHNIMYPKEGVNRSLETAIKWVAKAQAKMTKKAERWKVGEELCSLIGLKMLEDMEAGVRLGNQLEPYMKQYLKGEKCESNPSSSGS